MANQSWLLILTLQLILDFSTFQHGKITSNLPDRNHRYCFGLCIGIQQVHLFTWHFLSLWTWAGMGRRVFIGHFKCCWWNKITTWFCWCLRQNFSIQANSEHHLKSTCSILLICHYSHSSYFVILQQFFSLIHHIEEHTLTINLNI